MADFPKPGRPAHESVPSISHSTPAREWVPPGARHEIPTPGPKGMTAAGPAQVEKGHHKTGKEMPPPASPMFTVLVRGRGKKK
jgi:hypothetical protein